MNEAQRQAEIRGKLTEALELGGVAVDAQDIHFSRSGPDALEVEIAVDRDAEGQARAICQEAIQGIRIAGEDLFLRLRAREAATD